jgi:predicted DCC family thiol-disulfide oxidoreductase YuxK
MDRHRVLLYDGVCGFCDATVQFILKHDRSRRMRFAPLNGDYARRVFRRHPKLNGVDSLVLIETDLGGHEWISVRSNAVMRIALYLGGFWRCAIIFKLIPRFLRDAAYDLFARHRYRWFGRRNECAVPSARVRARFLD